MNGRKGIYEPTISFLPFNGLGVLASKELMHSEYMFSARTEKGPVTPRIVRGWIENLSRHNEQSVSPLYLDEVTDSRVVRLEDDYHAFLRHATKIVLDLQAKYHSA